MIVRNAVALSSVTGVENSTGERPPLLEDQLVYTCTEFIDRRLKVYWLL
jgi:hypothetical protein